MPELIEYTIGWICAIRTELVAATAILDEKHDDPEYLPANDDNAYVLGRIGRHNVVIAALPQGQYGLVSAAKVATDMLRSFTSVRVGLMVGLGGGAPNQKHDIRLGDIVVGSPGSGRGGVLQYDYGKTIQGKDFKLTGHLNQPPQCLLTALTVLGAEYEIDGHDIQAQINRVFERKPRLRTTYKKPDSKSDCLYIPSFEHAGSDTDSCATTCNDNSKLVTRIERSPEQDSPVIHYGLIASANQLMKDAHTRDLLSTKEDILCFEMEAAGLVNSFPCLVIRGICDYSDSHKNKVWQGYAAMAAAAFAKDLLQKVAPSKVAAERRLTEVLSNVDTKLSNISGSLSQSQRNLEALHTDRQTERVMRWLAAAEVSSNLNKAIETRHKGSGHKLIQSEAYVEWKRRSNSFLWLNGIPGCGKTILAATIIEDLQSDPGCSQSLLYYYFDFTDAQKQDFKIAIRSLLAQFYLKSGSAKAELDSLYSSCRNGWEQPSMKLLTSTFANIVQEVGEVYVVIDALDECLIRHDLLEWLQDIRAEQMNAHVIVTSRPEQDIQSLFSGSCNDKEIVTIRNQLLEDDIRNYVQARVREHEALSRWRKRPDIQKEIETTLIQKANGMFRWIACQLDALEKCCDPKTLRITLASLPKTLDETYARILARIPPEHMRQAIRLLQFLTYSERPLRIEEAVDAIAVDVGPEVPKGSRFDPKNRMPIPAEITVYCSSLVVLVRRELKRVSFRPKHILSSPGPKHILEEIQLAHFSVKDYLISDRLEKEAAQSLKEIPARSLMAEVCLTYLLQLDLGATEIQQKKAYPFSEYAANYWATYTAVGEKNSQTVRQLALELLQSPTSIAICRQVQTHLWEPPLNEAATGLYYASLLGLPRCTEILLAHNADINTHDDSYVEALHAASYIEALQAALVRGHVEVLQLLIEKGASIHSRGGKYGTALRAAVAGRQSHVVHLMQRTTPHINAWVAPGSDQWYPKLDTADQKGLELLRSAASAGNAELVHLLLDLGVAPDATGEILTLLISAIRSRNIEIVRLLLERGADLSATDRLRRTALSIAADEGYIETVKLLLKKGADLSATDDYGRTALSYAVRKGHVEIVKLLFEKGASWSIVDKYGLTPLQSAADFGQFKIFQLLLEKGADIMAQDWAGRSTLSFAIKSGCEELFSMLLYRSPLLVDLKDHYGSTALSVAARFGRTEMAKALAFSPKSDLISKDKFGRTALWWAQTQGHNDIASVLFASALLRGIPMPDISLPTGAFSFSRTARAWCHVCMGNLANLPRNYYCRLCLSDKFYVCSSCRLLGAHCLDASHVLELRVEREEGHIEESDSDSDWDSSDTS